MSRPDLFELFKSRVMRTDRLDGIGFIEVGEAWLKAGPLDCEEGTAVEAVLISNSHALCVSNYAVSESYPEYIDEMIDEYDLQGYCTELEGHGLSLGDEFTSKVVNVSGSGVANVIGRLGDWINIGPVSCEVGESVDLEYIGDNYAKCLEEALWNENYEVRLDILSENYSSVPVEVGEKYEGDIIRSFSDSSVVEINDVYVNLQQGRLQPGQTVVIRVTDFASQSANGEIIKKKDPNSEPNNQELNSKSENDIRSVSVEKNTDTRNIRDLRKKAKEYSQHDVRIVESSSSTKQYSRSTAVKEYAKVRADGICEGCKSPAPFKTSSGDPYLHVHHLEELSDGGSDTPRNVACLCPNCHYRIHHGQDGKEYNRQVIDAIREKSN